MTQAEFAEKHNVDADSVKCIFSKPKDKGVIRVFVVNKGRKYFFFDNSDNSSGEFCVVGQAAYQAEICRIQAAA